MPIANSNCLRISGKRLQNIIVKRRLWQVYRTRYFRALLNQINRKVKAAVYKFKNESWSTFAESLSSEDNTICKTASRIRRTRTHVLVINGPNGMAYINTEKAEAIAESLSSQFKPHSDLDKP